MINLSFSIDDQQVTRVLNNIDAALKDFREPLKQIGNWYVETQIPQQFGSEGTYFLGEQWEERKKDYSWPILFNTGWLANNFEFLPEEPMDGQIEISNWTVDYYQYHQTGTYKMAQRPILVVTPELQDYATKAFYEYFNNAIEK